MLIFLHDNFAAQTFVAPELEEGEYAQREPWACKILAEGKGKKREEKTAPAIAPLC